MNNPQARRLRGTVGVPSHGRNPGELFVVDEDDDDDSLL
jgi:hypothetical protein